MSQHPSKPTTDSPSALWEIGEMIYRFRFIRVVTFMGVLLCNSRFKIVEEAHDDIFFCYVVLISTSIADVFLTIIILYSVKYTKKQPISTYFCWHYRNLWQILLWIGVYFLFNILLGLFCRILGAISPSFFGTSKDNFLTGILQKKPLPAALFTIIVAPIYEEIFFRGYIFQTLKQSQWSTTSTIVLTTCLFTFLHHKPSLIMYIILFANGLLLGWARAKTNSLMIPICLHGWNNFLFVCSEKASFFA